MHLDLTQGKLNDHMVKLAVPAVIGYLFHTMFNMTDTFFAGQLSTEALAALSLSASVFFMVLAIGIGMSEAVTSLLGNALGEQDIPKAQHIALNAIVFALVLSIILSVSGVLSVPYLIDALGDPSYRQETLDYINIILYASFFFIGAFFFSAFLNAMGDTKSFRNVLIFTAFVNILLDYSFIHIFEMGVLGIAMATVISEAIVTFYLFYKVRKTQLWSGLQHFEYDSSVIKELLKQGLPPSVNMFMMAFGMYIITYFVAPFGKEAVASFGIGMRIEQIFLMPIVGLSIATLAIISQNNGAKAYARIRPTLSLALRYGWIMSTIAVITFIFFAPFLSSLLSSNLEVITQATLYLRVAGVGSYGFVVIFIYISMLQGIAKPMVIMPISIYRQVLAPIVVLPLLAWYTLGIIYLWIAIDIFIFSSALFLWWYGEKKIKMLFN